MVLLVMPRRKKTFLRQVIGFIRSMNDRNRLWIGIFFVLLYSLSIPASLAGEQVNTLLIGMLTGRGLLDKEPLVDYTPVMTRGADWETMQRMVRLYFPRTYEDMQKYDYIMLNSPEYYIFTDQQDRWMHDRIQEGGGGWNDASVFSQIAQIHNAWANSQTQKAFPNDAPAVVDKHGGGESLIESYRVRINRDFPDPVLTPFIPYDVESAVGFTARFIIARQGSGILAYQVDNHPGYTDVPFLTVWDYGQGRAMTSGSIIASVTWFGRDNPYAGDIVTNLILYTMKRDLIEDVDIFHSLKTEFGNLRDKMAYLISVMNFVDRLGAHVERVQTEADRVRQYWDDASDAYLDEDFNEAHDLIQEGLDYLKEAEKIAIEEKNKALWWIFVIEWSVTTATLFVSSYVLWSLMVRRKMYKAVETSRMSRVESRDE